LKVFNLTSVCVTVNKPYRVILTVICLQFASVHYYWLQMTHYAVAVVHIIDQSEHSRSEKQPMPKLVSVSLDRPQNLMLRWWHAHAITSESCYFYETCWMVP